MLIEWQLATTSQRFKEGSRLGHYLGSPGQTESRLRVGPRASQSECGRSGPRLKAKVKVKAKVKGGLCEGSLHCDVSKLFDYQNCPLNRQKWMGRGGLAHLSIGVTRK